jgi:hypothetical protein
MMSTAILMAMGAEQSGKQPAAHDIENFDGPTFAQTLDARVGISSAIPEQDLGKDWKTEPTTKNLVDSPDLAAGAKAKIFAGQLTSAQVESKDINFAKTESLHPAIVAGTKVQKKTEEVEAQVAEPVGNTEESQTESPAVAQVAPAVSLQTEETVPLKQTAGKNQIQLPQVQTPVSPREALAAGKAQEAAPEKKTAAKTQAGDPTQPVATAKNGTVTVPPIVDETKSTHGVGLQGVVQAPNPTPAHAAAASALPVAIAESAVPATPAVSAARAVPVATSNIAFNVEGGKSGVGSGAASLSGSTSSGVAPAATEVSGSSKNVHGAKTSASDRETTPTAPGDPAAAAKSDAKDERSQATAANGGDDSDTKTHTTGGAPVAAVHALASGSEVTAASLAPVITGLTKLSGSEGSSSTAGSSVGLREQDGSGGVSRSTEPVPRTLSATPTALEVGIPDGTHGWLKVRAEIAEGGVVNASVSAASAASQEMLHRELPSLTAYLQSEKVAVNTVVVHPTASAGAESRGNSAGLESGGSGQAPRQSHEGGQQQSSMKTAAEVAEDVTSYRGLHGVDEDGMSPLASYGSGGSWLSVRA